MEKCSHCGNSLVDSARFCTSCGKPASGQRSLTAVDDIFPAAMTGKFSRVLELLDAGVPVDAIAPHMFGVKTPLFLAAENGHAAVVSLLLERGATPDARDEVNATPLMHESMPPH